MSDENAPGWDACYAVISADITPPPVGLILPVPGAGPLGSFCSCTFLKVAMQMLREQGGPAPFEGGRNGRARPQIGGPAPIIALPPTSSADPRRIRR
nr:serrate RNA effector molecule [Ipomoea batatas]